MIDPGQAEFALKRWTTDARMSHVTETERRRARLTVAAWCDKGISKADAMEILCALGLVVLTDDPDLEDLDE